MTVVPDIDIWRSAKLLVKQHGADALTQAAMRADAVLAKGDLTGYAAWQRIILAVEELTAIAPEPGRKVH